MAHCSVISHTERIIEAFAELRRGYPDKPFGKQSRGRPFREAADIIIRNIASETMRRWLFAVDLTNIVVLMPWRAGLAFGQWYRVQGVRRSYHVSARRDERTLKTIVDYEEGDLSPADHVIVADPMLATGNTTCDAIARAMAHGGVPENQIIVNAVVAAPEGIRHVNGRFPGIPVMVGDVDRELDARGYIVPGLGDFGDKYFCRMSQSEKRVLIDGLRPNPGARQKLRERLGVR